MMWQCHVSSSECRCYRLNGFSLLKRFPLSADGACGKALDQPVGEWLEHVGLPQYESKFLLNGFDDLRFMVSHLRRVIPGVASALHHPAPFVFVTIVSLFPLPPPPSPFHSSSSPPSAKIYGPSSIPFKEHGLSSAA